MWRNIQFSSLKNVNIEDQPRNTKETIRLTDIQFKE